MIRVTLSLCLPSSNLESLQIYGAVKILLVVTFGLLWRFCARSYRLSDSWVRFAGILVKLNTFRSFDFAPKRNKFLITWAVTLTLNANFCWQKEEILGKIQSSENYDGLPVAKWALHNSVLFIFSVGHFSLLISVTHFILRSGYCFADGIR